MCCNPSTFSPPLTLPCLLSFSSLLSPALLLPWLNIWMQHPLMITKHTAMTHSQTAKNTHKKRKRTEKSDYKLLRETRYNVLFLFPLRALLNSLYSTSHSPSSRLLISSSSPLLHTCSVWQKTHFLSSLQSFHLCLIHSFLVVCHGEITETGTINRRPGRLLLLFKSAIKDIHHHQAIDNQALLSSFIP